MRPAPQLFVFLILLSLASANKQVQKVRQLQEQLAAATTAEACEAGRAEAIKQAEERLKNASDCHSTGSTLGTYSELRLLCRQRIVLHRQVKHCRSRCSRVRRRLHQALAACVFIFWEKRSERGRCPDVEPFKRKLKEIREQKCSEGPGRSADELREALAKAEEGARKSLGLAEPAYSTSTIDPVGEVPDSVVFILHGIGQTSDRLRFVAELLIASGQFPKTRYVLPQANIQFNTFFNRTLPSWFDILSNQPDGPQAVDEVIQAASNVNDLMEIQRAVYGIEPKRILLYGFSQGGALALTVYLRHEVGAAFVFSGYLPILSTYPEALNPASQESPAVMVHGDEDEIVPVEAARLSRDALRAFGRKIKYIEFPGEGHDLSGVRPRVLEAAIELLSQVLTRNP